MILPPMGTVVAGVNTMMGLATAPAVCDKDVMDVKAVIAVAAEMMTVSRPAVKVAS